MSLRSSTLILGPLLSWMHSIGIMAIDKKLKLKTTKVGDER